MDRLALRAALLFAIVATSACVDPLTTQPVATPVWEVKNVAGYAETVAGLRPDVAFGCDLRVAAGVARWRECESFEVCGDTERERPADQLLAFERVGDVNAADGHEIVVVKLSLAPRAKYVVPVRKLPR